MSFINTSKVLYGREVTIPAIPEQPFIKKSGYRYVPTLVKEALRRGDIFYIGIELYLPTQDEIWAKPETAVFCFSDSRFQWRNRLYKDKVQQINSLTKFIGKQFNTLGLEITNVERGSNSGSSLAFKNLIRGFRVGVRLIFPNLDVKYSRLIWWGRVVKTEDIDENKLGISCTQEVGDFSYELATQKYGQACPLWFGHKDCLGTETLIQKSLLYQKALQLFGQGGCNRTKVRCVELGNDEFYQGQNVVTITGQFFRETTEKKTSWWFWSWLFGGTKKVLTPVQFSSKNQSDNSNVTIPIGYGRIRVPLHPFTWADGGTQISALMGALKGPIEGFYNVRSHNPQLTIASLTPHLGEFGGVGTQQPDPRFPASGYNSMLAYGGVTLNGSPPDDEPEEVPNMSAVLKAKLIPVRQFDGSYRIEWSFNGVWITRDLMTNFQYTVVPPAWFDNEKLQETADYNFEVVEDDTGAEIPVLTGSSFADYGAGQFQRFRSVGRVDAEVIGGVQSRPGLQSSGQNVDHFITEELVIPTSSDPDIIWGNGLDFGGANIPNRTYLQYRYTTNGYLNDKAKLSDVLHGLVLPTFKGFIKFNQFGLIEIDSRKPVDNTYIRADVPVTSDIVPVTNVKKFYEGYGYLLIGTGLSTAEIAKVVGISYANGSAQTVVTASASSQLDVTVSPSFIERDSAPSEIYMDFSGIPVIGEKIELVFTEPDGSVLKWDYYVDAPDSLDLVVKMFQIRLMASLSFKETWTAEVFNTNPYRIIIRCQTGFIKTDRQIVHHHFVGEEILRIVEVYEDGKDSSYDNPGVRDNIVDFILNDNPGETYHGVKATYISAVQDFKEVEIQPRVAWDAADNERNLNFLELDYRWVDNYRQSAFLLKSATIQTVDGNLPASLTSGILASLHEEGECIAVRHQTMEGVSYTPFTVEALSYEHQSHSTKLGLRIYLSAAFDERIAKEEKFLESTLTQNSEPTITPPPILAGGGFSTTGTGDGSGNIRQNIKYEPQPYETFKGLQVFSPHGRDRM